MSSCDLLGTTLTVFQASFTSSSPIRPSNVPSELIVQSKMATKFPGPGKLVSAMVPMLV